jgi:hypothetical protein
MCEGLVAQLWVRFPASVSPWETRTSVSSPGAEYHADFHGADAYGHSELCLASSPLRVSNEESTKHTHLFPC